MGGGSEGCHSGHHKVSVLAVIFVPLFVIIRKESNCILILLRYICFRMCTAVGVGESPEDSLCDANDPFVYNYLFLFQDMYSRWSGGFP